MGSSCWLVQPLDCAFIVREGASVEMYVNTRRQACVDNAQYRLFAVSVPGIVRPYEQAAHNILSFVVKAFSLSKMGLFFVCMHMQIRPSVQHVSNICRT